MSALAAIRPDDWNLPLFIHVLGAFTLIGALAMSATYLLAARRDGSLELIRTGFRALLIVGLPAYLAMRSGAQWIANKEGLEDSDAMWITFGYASSEGGLLVLIGATVAAGLALRRAGRGGGGGRGVAVATWLVGALIVLYLVAIWIMATKPA